MSDSESKAAFDVEEAKKRRPGRPAKTAEPVEAMTIEIENKNRALDSETVTVFECFSCGTLAKITGAV